VEGLVARIAGVDGLDVLILSQIDGGDGFWARIVDVARALGGSAGRRRRELAFSVQQSWAGRSRTAFLLHLVSPWPNCPL